MSLRILNPTADHINRQALEINAAAALGLMNVVKTNLGPNGTLKLLVSASGDLKLTKDGCVLLDQMQIQNPTANLIAKTATAQDKITGDGTTSTVIFIGELLKQALMLKNDGVHPRIIASGIEKARLETLNFLKEYKTEIKEFDREMLYNIVRTSLSTKLIKEVAHHFTNIIVEAFLTIYVPTKQIDLFMIEIMHMQHRSELDSRLVKGLVLDHGFRHPAMPKASKNCYILTCNIPLEFEKTEVNSGFFYSDTDMKNKMVKAERFHINERLNAIVKLKNQVVTKTNNKSFLVINQKGIDPISLDFLHNNGILAIRRAKRRNMERIPLACGGCAVNSLKDLTEKSLGYADTVIENTLGEDVYTFIEGVKNPLSCTILIKGPDKHTIIQIKDAIRDGQRAIKNTFDDKAVINGGGAFETACHVHLNKFKDSVKGRDKLGIEAFSNAMLIIPKTLANNSGLNASEIILGLIDSVKSGRQVGIDLTDGSLMIPSDEGVYDNYKVKRHIYHLGSIMVQQILLVDEIMRAGKTNSQE